MYAIISDGGRQYRVEEGQKIEVDFRDGLDAGGELTFDRVLAISGEKGIQLGTPSLDGVSITAKVIEATKGEKIYVQKFRRRKNSKRRTGHRQKYTRVEIGKIG